MNNNGNTYVYGQVEANQREQMINELSMQGCNFLFVDGEKIGTYCCNNAVYIDGNRRRCEECKDRRWPEATFHCKRIITKGKRKGQPCNNNTKFADEKCSVCRKMVGTARTVRLAHNTSVDDDNEEDIKSCVPHGKTIVPMSTFVEICERDYPLPQVSMPTSEICTTAAAATATLAEIYGFPTFHPIEEEGDRHLIECPKL